MCKPVTELEKEMLASMHKHEPMSMMVAFAAALDWGKCQIVKHIADNYIGDFPKDLQPHIERMGKIVTLVESLNDEKDPAEQTDIEGQLDALMKAESAAIDEQKKKTPVKLRDIIGNLFGKDKGSVDVDGLEDAPPEIKAMVEEITKTLGKHGDVKVSVVKLAMPTMGDQLRH